jgi:hypothetical protein
MSLESIIPTHTSVNKLYTRLDNIETEEHNSKDQLEEYRNIVKTKDADLKKAVFQFKKVETNITRLVQERKDIRAQITMERERITQQHQETIKKLQDRNKELSRSIYSRKIIQEPQEPQEVDELFSEEPQEVDVTFREEPQEVVGSEEHLEEVFSEEPQEVVEEEEEEEEVEEEVEEVEEVIILSEEDIYRKELEKHMELYKKDAWCDIFLFAFLYKPSNNNQHAINFVNSMPNRHMCRLFRQQCHAWLSGKQQKLIKSTEDKYEFIYFIINFRNLVNSFRKEPILTVKDIYKLYDIIE